MPHKESKDKIDNKALHAGFMLNWEAVNDVERDQRSQANEDAYFAHVRGSQWNDKDKEMRAEKPMYEINRVVGAINLAVGEFTQNAISMKTIPLGSKATKEIATTMNGLTRNIENRSNMSSIANNAAKEIFTGGYGAWQVSKGFINEESFSNEQDISIEAIPDAANSVFFDNGSVKDNFKDANWCFVIADIPAAQFKKDYPNSIAASLDNDSLIDNYGDWCNTSKGSIRIADYWVKEPMKKTLVLMSDGTEKILDDDFKLVLDELALKGITEVKRKDIKSHKVVHYKISGAEILSGANAWDGIYIPVVMALGYTIWINGVRHVRGLVRMAKDSQRLYNYSRSAIVESQARSLGDSTYMTAEQAKGHEATIGKDLPVKIYNHVVGQPSPFKTPAANFQSALVEIANQASEDVKVTTAAFNESLGQNTSAKSGRAIIAIQEQSNLGTAEIHKNITGAYEYTTLIMLDLIPKTMDTERQENIINPDGTEEVIFVNKEEIDKTTGKKVIINDLSLGKYGAVASFGASFKTKQIEAINTIISLSEINQRVAEVTPDLVLDNMDSPIAQVIGERVHKSMLKDGLIEPTEEELKELQENEPQEPSEAEQMQKKLIEFELDEKAVTVDNLELDGELTKAQIAKTYAETNKAFADANKNSTRETPSELEAQEKAADAANTIIEETFQDEPEEEQINQDQPIQQEQLPTELDLQNQQI